MFDRDRRSPEGIHAIADNGQVQNTNIVHIQQQPLTQVNCSPLLLLTHNGGEPIQGNHGGTTLQSIPIIPGEVNHILVYGTIYQQK